MTIQKVLILLLPIGLLCTGNIVELVDLVTKIHGETNSKEILCLIGQHESSLVKSLHHMNSSMSIVILSSLENYSSEISLRNSLLVVHGQDQYKEQFEIIQPFMDTLEVRKFVIVYGVSLDCLREYFTILHSWKFTRIFGIADSNVSYAFLPYADINVQRLSEDPSASLPDALRDLNGFALRMASKNEIPRFVRFRNSQGIEEFGGFAPQIILAFLRRYNATYKEIEIFNTNKSFFQEVKQAILDNTIDMSMNVFPPARGVLQIRVKLLTWTIMVPILGYIDPNEYFVRPFSEEVWILIGVTGVYIAFVDFAVKKLVSSQADIRKSLSETFLAFLMNPSEETSSTPYRIKIQVFLFSFIMGNFYLISLTSFLTVFIRIKQMHTIHELIDHNVTIMMPEDGWMYMKDMGACPPEFENIAKVVEYSTYLREINSMNNTKFGYSSAEDRTEFLLGLQKHFGHPLFRAIFFPKIKYNLGFVLNFHSPFRENLNKLVQQIIEVGLIQKWDFDTTINAIKAGTRLDKTNWSFPRSQAVALNLDILRFAWNCLTKGLALASVVFVGEIVTNIVRMRKNDWMKSFFGLFNK